MKVLAKTNKKLHTLTILYLENIILTKVKFQKIKNYSIHNLNQAIKK